MVGMCAFLWRSLPPVSLALLSLVAIYTVARGFYPDVAWLQADFWAWVYPFGCLLLGWGFLFLPLLRPGRPDFLTRAFSAVALGGILLLLPLLLARERQLGLDAEVSRELAELREEVRLQEARRRQEKREESEQSRRGEEPDRFSRYEGRLPDLSLEKLREIDGRMRVLLQDQAEAYRRALREIPVRGPQEWMRFRTLDELETEIARHRDLYEKTRQFTELFESFEQRYLEALDEADLQGAARRIAIAELERILQNWRREEAYELRKLDVQALGSALQALQALRDNWGEWSYLPRENRLRFERPSQQQRFLHAVDRLERIQKEVGERSSQRNE